jgi:hypothetical protein
VKKDTIKYFETTGQEMFDNDDYLINKVYWLSIDLKNIKDSILLCYVGGHVPVDLRMFVTLEEYLKSHSK